jgi:Holliday junction resolvasome RuvABC endonuclease subunit
MEDMPKHAQSAGLTAMAHGVVRLALHQSGARVLTVPPATLKKYATGKGTATKADMRMALYQRVGIDLRDDNQVDAYWLHALGHHLLGEPLVVMPKLPKAHVAALDKLTLPDGVS